MFKNFPSLFYAYFNAYGQDLMGGKPPGFYLNQCWNVVNRTRGNKHQWNINRNLYICIQQNVFWKFVAILSRSQCVKTAPSNITNPKGLCTIYVAYYTNAKYHLSFGHICMCLYENQICPPYVSLLTTHPGQSRVRFRYRQHDGATTHTWHFS